MPEQALTTELSADQVIAQLKGQSSKHATDEALATVSTAGGFLPYIQLMGSNSLMVKQNKFPMGHFALMKNRQPFDLTDSFVAMLLSWRPKAMQYKPDVKSYFDHSSPEFKAIEEASQVANSNKGYGPEFLLWLPDFDQVATFFLGNISGRMEAPNFLDCIKNSPTRVCKIISELATRKRDGATWHVAKKINHDLAVKMPNMAKVQPVLETFNNPPAVEKDEADSDTNQRG